MTCPHCKGQGKREGSLGRLSGEFFANVNETCPLCRGEKTVTPEQAAIYRSEYPLESPSGIQKPGT